LQAQEAAPSDCHDHDPEWVSWSDEQLLSLPMNQLGVTLDGTFLSGQIQQLYTELEARQLRFRPHFWLSNEWFTPDGVPGIAVPFYLAHPRLAKLEMHQMLDVEGGTPEWCMRILRHEAGHAVENAYRLRRLRRRQQVFGRSSDPYPKYYSPRPYSRSFVRHLDVWYAQSHPDEDFAETFAVWLTPDSTWGDRYKGWPVLKKLQYVDELMEAQGGHE
jgi:Putative zinc-binding metallo-peptidase